MRRTARTVPSVPMKIVFMGTPEFALISLKGLLEEKYNLVAVVTQPDRPQGRGKKITPSPVKEYALEANLPCLQPVSVRNPEFIKSLRLLTPDLLVTAAYGQILPSKILAIPSLGAINVHASLLPRYRGAAPVHRAIMAGEGETGATIYYMDAGMDTGDIILQEKIRIEEDETTGELQSRLAVLGKEVLLKAVSLIREKRAARTPQNNQEVSYAPLLRREEEKINWSWGGKRIVNLINSLSPVPGAYTYFEQRRVKIRRAAYLFCQGKQGSVIQVTKEGILVAAGEGGVMLKEVQPAGKKVMTAAEFSRGYGLVVGQSVTK